MASTPGSHLVAVASSGAGLSLREILALEPRLHLDEVGESRSMALDSRVLELIDRRVEDGSTTLETGCGVSTLLLIAKGCHHISISPDSFAFTQIRAFCDQHGLPIERTQLVAEFSENVLPGMVLGSLDAVVIDGSHGFPAPFIDWFYASRALRVGGLLVVDDIGIWPPHVLKTFLDSSPEWELLDVLPGRSATYLKRANIDHPQDWWEQDMVVAETSRLGQGRLRNLLDMLHLHGAAMALQRDIARVRKARAG